MMNESVAQRLVIKYCSPIPFPYAVSPNMNRAGSMVRDATFQEIS